ncbi:MAG TPA: hypothetical protein VJ227_04030 [Patescibacteria group bacterium]|nr:hypothetical protein [Patescibacteria group bacterium]
MTNPENPANPLTKICLLDFKYSELRQILDDEALARRLTEYDESSALARIDELVVSHEAPVTGILLGEKTVVNAREEWTVEIPQELADSIKAFLQPQD